MKSSTSLLLLGAIATVMVAASADDLEFEGHDLVEPDCNAMSSWFECRDIDTAPPNVRLGHLYMHHTSETLGPDGNTVYSDTGEPYVSTSTACSSCHFTGGHVPFGTPVYQSPSKYQPDPVTGLGSYFTPLGYHRDLEDSIIDCFRNCMNAERAPEKDDPVMVALVDYIHWVADGIIDPAAKANWKLLPPEAGPGLPAIAGVASMRADPVRGGALYANNCADCHDEDGPGAGEYRIGEERPRIPALWGSVDGYSRGAAFFRTPVLAAYVQKHMPYDHPATLGNQDALDIAAFINAPDKPRGSGLADVMYCHDDPDGIPSALRKPADWLVGCEYPGERAHFEAQGIDYDDMVRHGPWVELAAWRAAEIERLLERGWEDLGQALAGTNGAPVLTASGNFSAGSSIELVVSNALAAAPGAFALGFAALDLPLVGGVLVPEPVVIFGFVTDSSGGARKQISVPSTISPGLELYAQAWIQDTGAIFGWSATNAVRAVFE